MHKRVMAALAGGALALGFAGSAAAMPPDAEMIELECDNGESYTIWTNGNGDWTPGHIVGSPGVLIPLSFEFSFTPEGGETETETVAKGNGNASRGNRDLVTCTFGDTIPGEGSFSGTVVGFIPGSR